MICMQFVAVRSGKLSLVWLKAFFLLQTLHYIHAFEFTHLSLLPNGRKDMAIDLLQICSTTLAPPISEILCGKNVRVIVGS